MLSAPYCLLQYDALYNMVYGCDVRVNGCGHSRPAVHFNETLDICYMQFCSHAIAGQFDVMSSVR